MTYLFKFIVYRLSVSVRCSVVDSINNHTLPIAMFSACRLDALL